MNQFYKKLPLLSDAGFISLSAIFQKYHIAFYCVGGSIRDYLLAEDKIIDTSKIDIDCAVPIPPTKVIEILENEHIRYITIGIEFGTIIAHLNGNNYEITSFRQDIKTNGRHAIVSYTPEMLLDAQRRDFTMNALYYDNQGIVYDPLGCGVSDLQQKKVHFIGNPHTRIEEDYLRILRYFRFLARFGMEYYNKTLFKKSDYHDGLSILSEHRIIHELKKMIAYPYASNALEEIVSLGYHAIIFKNLVLNIHNFQEFKKINPASEYLLASLLFQTDTHILKKNTLLPKKDKKNILDFVHLHNHIKEYLDKQAWIMLLELQYDYDIIVWRDCLSLVQSDYPDCQEIIDRVKNNILPPFTLTGKMLLEQGHKQGIEIAKILKQRRTYHVRQCAETTLNL
jgi:poly(A) polymerase